MADSGLDDLAHIHDPLDVAVYHTVHDFKGGAPALAKVIGLKPGVLQNKADLRMDGHELKLKQARSVVLATGDKRIPQQFAADCGGCFVPIERYRADGDVGLLDQFLAFDVVHGELAGEIRTALDDKRLTAVEVAGIEQTAQKLIAELQGMIASMHARRDD